jgi:hypothetical protein
MITRILVGDCRIAAEVKIRGVGSVSLDTEQSRAEKRALA